MDEEKTRGLAIRFMDGTSVHVSFPVQTEDRYKRKLMIEEVIKSRMLIVQAEGAAHLIPFENIKYMSFFPAPDQVDVPVIHGASFSE